MNIVAKSAYKLIDSFSEIKMPRDVSDFRLLDRKVVDDICRIPEKNKFMRGIVHWVGYKQTSILYTPPQREHGESKFRLTHYVNFALDGIFAFSVFPMRMLLWIGLILSFICISYALVYIVIGALNYFIYDQLYLPPGWASIVVSITLLGGVQLIGLGLIGEYISRIYMQTKQRPDYIVKEKNIN